jgi:hypothetical protein
MPASWALGVAVIGLIALFSPLSNPVGDPLYAWVARNRLRIMGAEQCEWKPHKSMSLFQRLLGYSDHQKYFVSNLNRTRIENADDRKIFPQRL